MYGWECQNETVTNYVNHSNFTFWGSNERYGHPPQQNAQKHCRHTFVIYFIALEIYFRHMVRIIENNRYKEVYLSYSRQVAKQYLLNCRKPIHGPEVKIPYSWHQKKTPSLCTTSSSNETSTK